MTSAELPKRILVAVDAEGLAANAFLQGAALARRLGSKLCLVHAVHIPASLWPGLAESEFSELRRTALDHARRSALERLDEARAGVDPGALPEQPLDGLLEVADGHPARVILERAEHFRADLIVLGHHKKRPLFDFGSTARAILSRIHVPVWIQPEAVTPIRRILVPIDFSEHSRRALDHARALALRLGAGLRLLHCYAPPAFAYSSGADGVPGPTYVIDRDRDAAREELQRWLRGLERYELQIESVFTEGESALEIVRESAPDDLIVMGTHGRGIARRFLLGSVAERVVRRSPAPVLTLHGPSGTSRRSTRRT